MWKVRGNTAQVKGRTADGYSKSNIVQEANNLVQLIEVLHGYDIKPVPINSYHPDWSTKIRCPFPSHKGGNERTPSFGYNFQSDSFNCFVCGGGRAAEFISKKEQVSLNTAVDFIVNNFTKGKVRAKRQESEFKGVENELIKFSQYLNSLIQENKHDEKFIENIHSVLWSLDAIYLIPSATKDSLKLAELKKIIDTVKDLI